MLGHAGPGRVKGDGVLPTSYGGGLLQLIAQYVEVGLERVVSEQFGLRSAALPLPAAGPLRWRPWMLPP